MQLNYDNSQIKYFNYNKTLNFIKQKYHWKKNNNKHQKIYRILF